MKKRRTFFMILILGLLLSTAIFIAHQTLRNDNSITLPGHVSEADPGYSEDDPDYYNTISITPETVQIAIATLSRPASYSRTHTVELFWNGGSSATTAQVAVSSGVMRIDMMYGDGTVCHTLVGSDTCAVWYDEDQTWVTLRADQYAADTLQRIPTYETVLDLPVSSIVQAGYKEMNGINCIYVLTAEDPEGYADCYYISVQSGLLTFAERTCNETVIYRFSAGEPQQDAPSESLFLLPDGSEFHP